MATARGRAEEEEVFLLRGRLVAVGVELLKSTGDTDG